MQLNLYLGVGNHKSILLHLVENLVLSLRYGFTVLKQK
uniref:Uncharacterized protein n=1 Tax=Rhizophora mucronata TaxID=61149 RepID=A0A2P2QM68_RHIMU